MKKRLLFILPFTLLILLVAACNSSESRTDSGSNPGKNNPTEPEELTPEQEAEAKVRVSFGGFLYPDDTFMLVPLKISQTKKRSGGILSDLRSESSYYDNEKGDWDYSSSNYNHHACKNLIFINRVTGENYLFTEQKMRIESFYFPSTDSAAIYSLPNHYLFRLIAEDTNEDGVLGGADEEALYVADRNGKNLSRISPENATLLDWEIDREQEKLYVKSLVDTNGDKKFNQLDDYLYTQFPLSPPFTPTPLIGQDVLENAISQLKSQWKVME